MSSIENIQSVENSRVIALEQKVLANMFSDDAGNVDETKVIAFIQDQGDAEHLREVTTAHVRDNANEDEIVRRIVNDFSSRELPKAA